MTGETVLRPGRARLARAASALSLLCRATLAVPFLWAGTVKVIDRQAFVVAVDAYAILPRALVLPVAAALPWVEILVGVFLVLGLFVRFAGLVSVGLVGIFLIALVQAKARGLAIDCGCFGGDGAGTGVTWWEIGRDLPLLLAGGFLGRWPRGPLRLDRRLLAARTGGLGGDHDGSEYRIP